VFWGKGISYLYQFSLSLDLIRAPWLSSRNALASVLLVQDLATDESVPGVFQTQRMVAFARGITFQAPIRPGLVVVSVAARARKRLLLICEVVGRLILTALQSGFKLRTFSQAAVTAPTSR
jgi:hypothetical protein